MSGKIVTRIMGGLGNQLCCYAAARRLALASGVELVIDGETGAGAQADASVPAFQFASSTFCWLTAWLGEAKDKVVIAPGTQTVTLSRWTFEGLMPEEWVKL